ncbi:serine/threonine-protein phosphatase 7 long form homolog isoform X2 [Gastrolobium bilobum]|nr:serine/threonine-protein phosphatase 7 long form homolog isoform X2 [Gastrolobium bilobum]
MRHLPIDHALISALVERWRPETHTFHMPQGECTITLQDVAAILGLPTDGPPVIGRTFAPWLDVIKEMLHVAPLPQELEGGNVRMTFLDRHYGHWVQHKGDPKQELLYTRAYLLRLIGGFLLCDKSSNKVPVRYIEFLGNFEVTATYSWGSAVLAHLFRELCQATNPAQKEMSGCSTLLQLWAWTRFPPISPGVPPVADPADHYGRRFNFLPKRIAPNDLNHYRFTLDTMGREEIVWQPYIGYHFLGASVETQRLWRVVTPIICFHIVEMHQADRVMRQFGMEQPIPVAPYLLHGVHDLTLRGKTAEDWSVKLRLYIERWETRHTRFVEGTDGGDVYLSPNSEYMIWYKNITRRYMTLKAAHIGHVVDGLEMAWWMAIDAPREDLQAELGRLIFMFREWQRIAEPGSAACPSQVIQEPEPHVEVPPRAREGHGLGRRRPRIPAQFVNIPQPGPRGAGIYRPPLYPSGEPHPFVYPP